MTTETPKLDPKLEPEEGTIVPTGDEENPVESSGQEESLKAIYKKSREDRSIVTREDEENNVDAELLAKMVAESQDDGEFEHPENDLVDLDARPDRQGAEEDPVDEIPDEDYIESAKPTEDEPEVTINAVDEVVKSPVVTTPTPEEQNKNLDYEPVDGKVVVKIEGMEYTVPEADIIAAGGLNLYQQKRASNQRFQKAATFGKALQKEREAFEQQQHDSPADSGVLPKKDELSKAELIKSYREKILDAALDGTDADVDKLIEEVTHLEEKPSEKTLNSDSSAEPLASDRVVEEFEADYKLQRAKANKMLADNYTDIMGNEDLRKIAQSKYQELDADPKNFGRTATELARESGEFVRKLANTQPATSASNEKLEVIREKKRILPRQSSARQTSRPAETKKPRSNRQYIQDIRRKQGNR